MCRWRHKIRKIAVEIMQQLDAEFAGNRLLRIVMRPSSLGGGRILRRTVSVGMSVCLSVCSSVCPSVPLSLPSVTSRHLANYNDTHVLFGRRRAAYRTAISAAQILVIIDINTLLGRVTLHPAGMHCSPWDDVFVSSYTLLLRTYDVI